MYKDAAKRKAYGAAWRAKNTPSARRVAAEARLAAMKEEAAIPVRENLPVTERQREFALAFVSLQAGPRHGDGFRAVRSISSEQQSRRGQSVRASQWLRNPAVIAEIGRCWVEVHLGAQVNSPNRTCLECAISFTGHHSAKFCSLECKRVGQSRRARLRFVSLSCKLCLSPFTGLKNRLYCSRECAAETNAARVRERSAMSGTLASDKKKWAERTNEYRKRHRAAYKALKELGIEV